MSVPPANSADNSFAPPPSAFPATQRMVRLRSFPWGMSLFTSLMGGIGGVMFSLWFGSMALVACGRWYGEIVAGVVSDKATNGRSHKNFRIMFKFQVDGREYSARMNVDQESDSRLKIGDPVQVRVWHVFPEASASIEQPNVAAPWNDVCFTGFVLLWNGIMVFVFWKIIRLAVLHRSLARLGTAVLAKITDKRITRGGKRSNYLVTYCYRSDGGKHEATMSVLPKDYEALQFGQAVTVLYDPLQPERSIIYRCGEFAVVGVE